MSTGRGDSRDRVGSKIIEIYFFLFAENLPAYNHANYANCAIELLKSLKHLSCNLNVNEYKQNIKCKYRMKPFSCIILVP